MSRTELFVNFNRTEFKLEKKFVTNSNQVSSWFISYRVESCWTKFDSSRLISSPSLRGRCWNPHCSEIWYNLVVLVRLEQPSFYKLVLLGRNKILSSTFENLIILLRANNEIWIVFLDLYMDFLSSLSLFLTSYYGLYLIQSVIWLILQSSLVPMLLPLSHNMSF